MGLQMSGDGLILSALPSSGRLGHLHLSIYVSMFILCMCICIYVYKYMCIYVYMHVCMYAYNVHKELKTATTATNEIWDGCNHRALGV